MKLSSTKQLIFTSSNYIVPCIIIFLAFLAVFLSPNIYSPGVTNGPCQIGEKPAAYDQMILDAPSWLDEGGKTDYILIRKNVPVGFEFDIHTFLVAQDFKPGYDVYFADSDMQKDTSKLSIHPKAERIIFLVRNDPASVGEALWADLTTGGLRKNIATGELLKQSVRQVDVYQASIMFAEGHRNTRQYKDPEEMFECFGTENLVWIEQVVYPSQRPSKDNQQLQLEWFAFQKNALWGVHCKPAVYLYPERKQLVNVKVFPKGELSYTEPVYDPQLGWNVEAYPDGTIYNSRFTTYPKSFSYLYYESKIFDNEIKKPTTGWIVEQSNLSSFFKTTLPQLGLNTKESQDFSHYWLKTLPNSPYYFIGLMDKSQRDYLEPLEVTPRPDTSIRFSFYFELLEQPKTVEAPKITTPERNGFTLVDWGGMIKLHPGTPFTCSQ